MKKCKTFFCLVSIMSRETPNEVLVCRFTKSVPSFTRDLAQVFSIDGCMITWFSLFCVGNENVLDNWGFYSQESRKMFNYLHRIYIRFNTSWNKCEICRWIHTLAGYILGIAIMGVVHPGYHIAGKLWWGLNNAIIPHPADIYRATIGNIPIT